MRARVTLTITVFSFIISMAAGAYFAVVMDKEIFGSAMAIGGLLGFYKIIGTLGEVLRAVMLRDAAEMVREPETPGSPIQS